MLWNQLNKETREHHVTCVELFYRLHCLAPTASICEDIICHALLDPDKASLCSPNLHPARVLAAGPACHFMCPGQTSYIQLRSFWGSGDILVNEQKC